MIAGKGGGSFGVGTPEVSERLGDEGSPSSEVREEIDCERGWAWLWASGTKPAARILGLTMHRASRAPWECLVS